MAEQAGGWYVAAMGTVLSKFILPVAVAAVALGLILYFRGARAKGREGQ